MFNKSFLRAYVSLCAARHKSDVNLEAGDARDAVNCRVQNSFSSYFFPIPSTRPITPPAMAAITVFNNPSITANCSVTNLKNANDERS